MDELTAAQRRVMALMKQGAFIDFDRNLWYHKVFAFKVHYKTLRWLRDHDYIMCNLSGYVIYDDYEV